MVDLGQKGRKKFLLFYFYPVPKSSKKAVTLLFAYHPNIFAVNSLYVTIMLLILFYHIFSRIKFMVDLGQISGSNIPLIYFNKKPD